MKCDVVWSFEDDENRMSGPHRVCELRAERDRLHVRVRDVGCVLLSGVEWRIGERAGDKNHESPTEAMLTFDRTIANKTVMAGEVWSPHSDEDYRRRWLNLAQLLPVLATSCADAAGEILISTYIKAEMDAHYAGKASIMSYMPNTLKHNVQWDQHRKDMLAREKLEREIKTCEEVLAE